MFLLRCLLIVLFTSINFSPSNTCIVVPMYRILTTLPLDTLISIRAFTCTVTLLFITSHVKCLLSFTFMYCFTISFRSPAPYGWLVVNIYKIHCIQLVALPFYLSSLTSLLRLDSQDEALRIQVCLVLLTGLYYKSLACP